MLPSNLLAIAIGLTCFLGVEAMIINRIAPQAGRGFKVDVTVVPNEIFWLCFGYVPTNESQHHSFRWDLCTDERTAFNGANGFAYTLHASWENQLLNLRFWRTEITSDDYLLVDHATLPPSNTFTITHTRGITAINENTIKYSSIVRAIEAPIPIAGGPVETADPKEHKLDTLRVLDKTVEVRGLKDKGVIVIGNGRGIQSMQLSEV